MDSQVARIARWIIIAVATAGCMSAAGLTVAGIASASAPPEAVFMGGDYFDVFSSELDGSGLTRLTNCATNSNDCIFYWPVLSPDGRTVAVESGHASITLLGSDGSSRRELVRDETHQAYYPAWHPDGERILYTRYSGDVNSGDRGDEDLYMLATTGSGTSDGSDAVAVITGPGDQEEGDYSPDGTKIVYNGNDDPNDTYGIWVARSDGTDRQRFDLGESLNNGVAFDAHFSPDGTKIAFVARPTGGTLNLYVVDADGQNLRQLTTDGNYYYPTWTADGKILVNGATGNTGSIGLVDPTAANPTYAGLINPPYPDFSPYPDTYSYGEDIGSTRKPSTLAQPDVTAPTLSSSGRLRSLEGKRLYADDYALHVEARDDAGLSESGMRSIEIQVDGTRKDYVEQPCAGGGCAMTRDWAFRGLDYPSGDHAVRVIATDQAGNHRESTWTVSVSEAANTDENDVYAPTYESDLVQDGIDFRSSFRLTTKTEDDIRGLINEPQYDPSLNEWGVQLTDDELLRIDDAAAALASRATASATAATPFFDRVAAGLDADQWALETRGKPFQRIGDTDCANFVSAAWHFGGGLRMTKNWYMKKAFDLRHLRRRKWSPTWTVAFDFARYMVHKRQIATFYRANETLSFTPASLGDAILYDHGGGSGWSHLAIVTQVGEIDRINQHTTDRRRVPWNYGYTHAPKDQRRKSKAIIVHVNVAG